MKIQTIKNISMKESVKESVVIKTDRLIIRQWKPEDFEPFAKLNADPRVREFFPSTLTSEKSNEQAKAFSDEIAESGWGFWAVSVPGISEFIGFIGLRPLELEVHFTPAVEIGWRLALDFWGKGYATEGALAVLKYGFEVLDLDQIVSITTVTNIRSRHIMEKIGMHRLSQEDFNHPALPEGHPLKKHVLYRLRQQEWKSKHSK